MAGQWSHVISVTTTAGIFTPPTNDVGGNVRFHNLDGTNSVWLKLGGNPATTVAEADDTVRIGPGEQYVTGRQQKFNLLAVGGTVKVLMENV